MLKEPKKNFLVNDYMLNEKISEHGLPLLKIAFRGLTDKLCEVQPCKTREVYVGSLKIINGHLEASLTPIKIQRKKGDCAPPNASRDHVTITRKQLYLENNDQQLHFDFSPWRRRIKFLNFRTESSILQTLFPFPWQLNVNMN